MRDSGTTTFYLNGVAYPQSVGSPGPISGAFVIGGAGSERFVGLLDEARLLTFTTPFQTSSLLYNVPAAIPTLSEYGMIVFGCLMMGTLILSIRKKSKAAASRAG